MTLRIISSNCAEERLVSECEVFTVRASNAKCNEKSNVDDGIIQASDQKAVTIENDLTDGQEMQAMRGVANETRCSKKKVKGISRVHEMDGHVRENEAR